MKKFVLVRDDDVNYFTSPKQLETVHRPLLERGLPVNVSVIPKVSAASRIPDGERNLFYKRFGLRYEPFIPRALRGQERSFELTGNRDLISFISSSPIEVLQHGYTHEWDGGAEFEGNNKDELRHRLERGRKILTDAFGRSPDFFCAPYDRISRAGLRVVKQSGFLGISLEGFGRNLPYSLLPRFLWNRHVARREWLIWDTFLLVRRYESALYLLGSPQAIGEQFSKHFHANQITVIVLHSWEFNFDGKDEIEPDRLRLYHSILDSVLKNPHAEFLTFRALHDLLRA